MRDVESLATSGIRRQMARIGAAAAALLVFAAVPSRAAEEEMIDFEVVSIDSRSWVVTARDVDSGETFRFKVPPKVFEGQRFTADLGSVGAGQALTVEAPRDVRLDKLVVEAPMGSLSGRPSSDGDREMRRPATRPRPPREPGPPGLATGPAGMAEYRVEAVDSRTWTVTAVGPEGSRVQLAVDPEKFEGYRFRASAGSLRRGQGFSLFAGNESPLRDCCTLKSATGR